MAKVSAPWMCTQQPLIAVVLCDLAGVHCGVPILGGALHIFHLQLHGGSVWLPTRAAVHSTTECHPNHQSLGERGECLLSMPVACVGILSRVVDAMVLILNVQPHTLNSLVEL